MLVRFYRTLDRFSAGKISVEEKDRVVQEISDIVGTYMFVATCCEARHAKRCTSSSASNVKRRKEIFGRLDELGLHLPDDDEEHGNRDKFVKFFVPQPSSLQHAIDIQSLLVELYNDISWSASYGGPKWGEISKWLLDYLKGGVTRTLFVDGAFNKRHNGGMAFDKFSWIQCDNSLLNTQLDIKQKGSVTKLITKTATERCIAKEEVIKRSDRQALVEVEVPVVEANTTVGGKKPSKLDPSPKQVAATLGSGKGGTKVAINPGNSDNKRAKPTPTLSASIGGMVSYKRKLSAS